jgi:hypothetical protein
MLHKIKQHLNKGYNLVFWGLFGPAMFITLSGVYELYTKYFDLLSAHDHLQFFLRFFLPISLGLVVTSLERRQRIRRKLLRKQIQKYLEN